MFAIQSNMSFDANAAWKDLFNRLYALSHEWGQFLRDRMDENRQFYFDFDMDYEVRGEIGRLITDIYPAGGETWEAWLEEFGKGSDMTTDNPYLDQYKDSAYWNELRGDNPTIVGRAEGDYVGIDGQTHRSSGKMAGLDLEQLAQETGNEAYMPTPATFFIRDTMQVYREDIYKELQKVVADWLTNLPAFFTS